MINCKITTYQNKALVYTGIAELERVKSLLHTFYRCKDAANIAYEEVVKGHEVEVLNATYNTQTRLLQCYNESCSVKIKKASECIPTL